MSMQSLCGVQMCRSLEEIPAKVSYHGMCKKFVQDQIGSTVEHNAIWLMCSFSVVLSSRSISLSKRDSLILRMLDGCGLLESILQD